MNAVLLKLTKIMDRNKGSKRLIAELLKYEGIIIDRDQRTPHFVSLNCQSIYRYNKQEPKINSREKINLERSIDFELHLFKKA